MKTEATLLDLIVEVSQGNPGATVACAQLVKAYPDEAPGWLLRMRSMSPEVIWIIYKESGVTGLANALREASKECRIRKYVRCRKGCTDCNES